MIAGAGGGRSGVDEDRPRNRERDVGSGLRRGGSAAVPEKEVVSNADAYARQVDMFSTAIERNLGGPVPGEEGWQNQDVLDAAYRSLKSGKAETVPLVEKKR